MRKSIWAEYRRASRCGLRVKGKRYGCFPVRASWSGLDRNLYRHEVEARIVAESSAAAANYWVEYWAARVQHPVEVEAVGYKGGVVHRFRGWEGCIAAAMFASDGPPLAKQMDLPVVGEVRGKRDWRRWLNMSEAGQWFASARRAQDREDQ
jgi:hypothetical protein